MMPIRRGDGTGLSVPGFSEVRKGDGTVLWSAAADIPDREDLHARYDFSEEDGATPVTDQTGNGFDLSGSYSGVGVSINGVQAGDFDGTDDSLEVSFSNQLQPNHVFIVVEPRDTAETENEWFDADTEFNQTVGPGSSSQFRGFAGSNVAGGSISTSTPYIVSVLFNETSSTVRVNGSEVASGDIGTSVLDGIALGSDGGGGRNADAKIGEVLVYPQDKSTIETDVESYLSDKWGITV